MIVLGSKAAVMQGVSFNRIPLDLDLLGTYGELERLLMLWKRIPDYLKSYYPSDSGNKYIIKTVDNIVEFEIAWLGSNTYALMEIINNDVLTTEETLFDFTVKVASLDVLLMLKLSHRYKKNSVHFRKTMDDIIALRSYGAKMRPEWEEWFKWREKDTYTNNLPKLNTTKDKFFKDAIYTYDHDSIHEAVKHLDKPAYEYFKPVDSPVMVSKAMWDELDDSVKLLAVLEESYVLALERSQIPHPNTDRKVSFDIALEKVCTSITSGWFREYAWENYYAVQKLYNENYVDKFKTALDKGLIKDHVIIEED